MVSSAASCGVDVAEGSVHSTTATECRVKVEMRDCWQPLAWLALASLLAGPGLASDFAIKILGDLSDGDGYYRLDYR